MIPIDLLRWPEALDKAYESNTESLCHYLRSVDRQLNITQRDELAKFIDRKLHHKSGKGRKPGKPPNIAELVVAELDVWKTFLEKQPESVEDSKELSRSNIRKRHAMYDQWHKALYQGWRGKTNDLCNYLRARESGLYFPQRSELADLIETRLTSRSGPGRRPGPDPTPNRFQGKIMTEDVVARAKFILDGVRECNGGRVPRGKTSKALEDARVFFIEEGYSYPRDFDFNEDRALVDLRRGKRPRR